MAPRRRATTRRTTRTPATRGTTRTTAPATGSSGAGTGTSRPGPTNGQRVVIDLPGGEQAKVTQRIATKAGFTKVNPRKGEKGRYLRGYQGTKSIVLHFDSASSDLRGRKDLKRAGKASMAMPVSQKAGIDDYIALANQAGASAVTTPHGVTYPVSGGGGRARGGGRAALTARGGAVARPRATTRRTARRR